MTTLNLLLQPSTTSGAKPNDSPKLESQMTTENLLRQLADDWWSYGGDGGCVTVLRLWLKPKSLDVKIQVFGSEYEILNVDPDEYSYICFIKDMNHCVANENQVVQLYPDEEFKIEEIKGMRTIRVYVEVKPLNCVEGIGLLEAPNQCENDNGSESLGRQVNDLDEGEGELSEYQEDNEDVVKSGSSEDDDAVSRFSKNMKGQEFAYGAGGKIQFKVGQAFQEVYHFRKIRKSTETHTCLRVYNNPSVTSAWVVDKMGDFIKSQKGSSIKSLYEELSRKHYLDFSKHKLYSANKQTKESPDRIPEVPKFYRCFLDFVAQKKGFIGVDGCHLKDLYGGVLLSIVSMDANDDIFPLAIGINPIIFMSDRQKGLVDVVQACWPNARVMNDVRAADENAHWWMIDNDVISSLRRAFDLESKSNHVTNNM
ncbi:hypothetical protein Pint_00652 [Pistacia integerrima]|uniref:Uncharacterized protein n=1 Tax=Pistacia integerrima TaxID=434235 RepID=A0ACC0ZIK5_9ROSI|nr:hypothetical protein Pint_00652 [Pistacia integerrima]